MPLCDSACRPPDHRPARRWSGADVRTLLLAGVVATGTAAAVDAQPAAPPVVDIGLGRGVTIKALDDSASLTIRARVQTRATIVDNPTGTAPDTIETLIRRARLVFQGNANGPAFTYYVQLSFATLDNEADLRLPLRDAYVTWSPRPGLNVRVNQMKVPFSRQRVVSSSALQMVDRSIVVTELNLDRDVGLQLFARRLFGTRRLGYAAGIFGGEGRNRLGRPAGLLYTARVEAWPLGAFDDLMEGDVNRDQRLRLALGASVGLNQRTNRPRSTIGTPFPSGDVDYTHAGADLLVKWRGASMTAEYLYRGARHADVGALPRPGWGAFVQGGYMVSARAELTARYSHLTATGTAVDPTFRTGDETGGGVSYYVHGHDLKVQGDVVRVTAPAVHRPVRQARVQLQLFF